MKEGSGDISAHHTVLMVSDPDPQHWLWGLGSVNSTIPVHQRELFVGCDFKLLGLQCFVIVILVNKLKGTH